MKNCYIFALRNDGITRFEMPEWLSWLEHMTVNHGVLGSSPCSGADARGLRKGSFKKRLQGVVRKRVVRRVIGRLPLQSQAIFRGA